MRVSSEMGVVEGRRGKRRVPPPARMSLVCGRREAARNVGGEQGPAHGPARGAGCMDEAPWRRRAARVGRCVHGGPLVGCGFPRGQEARQKPGNRIKNRAMLTRRCIARNSRVLHRPSPGCRHELYKTRPARRLLASRCWREDRSRQYGLSRKPTGCVASGGGMVKRRNVFPDSPEKRTGGGVSRRGAGRGPRGP